MPTKQQKMEFTFKLSDYFNEEISIIGNNLLPKTFNETAEKRRYCVSAVTEILDKMGQASAKAQKLINPVTSAIKFSHCDQILYLMVSFTENNYNGSVIGYLKMGWKDLFIFDLNGSYNKKHCFCCLDFYIHESKQRQGFGKKLFDFMLFDSKITACTIPIDRPSEKLLKFLRKHYNLRTIIPQSNNFILYEQFFESGNSNINEINIHRVHYNKNKKSVIPQTNRELLTFKNCVSEQWFKNAGINR